MGSRRGLCEVTCEAVGQVVIGAWMGNANLSSDGSDLLERHSYITRKNGEGIELFEFWVLVNLSLLHSRTCSQ